MKPSVYVTPHQHSRVIGEAFSEGCDGKLIDTGWRNGRLYELFSYRPVKSSPIAMYGILRGTGGLIKQAEALSRDYWYIDNGYFLPGHYHGYYRVTKNALQHTGEGNYPKDRWERLGLQFSPWRRGRNIVVCPISQALGGFFNVSADVWIKAVVNELKKHSDRPIVIKQKDGTPLGAYLDDAWCVVSHSSNSAVDAVVAGVPAFALGRCGVNSVALSDLSLIEHPAYPDREQWAANLAYQQFTLEEFRSGKAWRLLNE